MEKRYQVFLSSTYEDLKEERLEVIKALLELDCFPAGMEHFPAASEDQWTYIKRLIDQCDYYIVIIGGKYGSTDRTGKSYTQKEYEYAIKKNIPVIAFIRNQLDTIPANKSETDPESKGKLNEFRKLAQQKLCKFWNTPYELGAVVSRSLTRLINQHPRRGWIRAESTMNPTTISAETLKSTSIFSENYVNNSLNFQNAYRTCKNLVIAGYAQNRMMVSYSSEVKRILSENGAVRIIVMDPNGAAIELANKRSSNPAQLESIKHQHEAALSRLTSLKSSCENPNNFEIRLVDFVLPYTIYGFDINDNEKGKLFVWLTPFQEPSINRPGFCLTTESDETWFNFFKSQFEKIWKWEEAKKYNLW